MSLRYMESFGTIIRNLRVQQRLLVREVAAKLEIDPSLLSRIERGEKRMTRDQIGRLSRILGIGEDALLIHYLSDRVVYELRNEKLALRAMEVAEQKIAYQQRSRRSRSKSSS